MSSMCSSSAYYKILSGVESEGLMDEEKKRVRWNMQNSGVKCEMILINEQDLPQDAINLFRLSTYTIR